MWSLHCSNIIIVMKRIENYSIIKTFNKNFIFLDGHLHCNFLMHKYLLSNYVTLIKIAFQTNRPFCELKIITFSSLTYIRYITKSTSTTTLSVILGIYQRWIVYVILTFGSTILFGLLCRVHLSLHSVPSAGSL